MNEEDIKEQARNLGHLCHAICADYDEDALIPPPMQFSDNLTPFLRDLVKKASQGQRFLASIPINPVGCKIQIIGGSIYPKEEGWHLLCPHCTKWLDAKLSFDDEACEFNLIIVPDNSEERNLEEGKGKARA